MAAANVGAVLTKGFEEEIAPPAECPSELPIGAIDTTGDSQARPVPVRYAPLVSLHPDEQLFPLSAECFLRNSSLVWADGAGRQEERASRGTINVAGLVRPGYAFGSHTTGDYTRPFGARRGAGLDGRRGFDLDLDDVYRGGARNVSTLPGLLGGAPVYYEYEARHYVAYWLFFGFSAPAAQLKRGGARFGGHEGDWEGIVIELDEEDRPVRVRYFAHGEETPAIEWSRVPKYGEHPRVYSALGSHASYSGTGRQADWDLTGRGLEWRTWLLLADARLQPWYGFGGAWGVARVVSPRFRRIAVTFGKTIKDGEFTGPLGPSRFKNPAP